MPNSSLFRLGLRVVLCLAIYGGAALRAEDAEPTADATPAVAYSIEALAPTLTTPEAAFAFVRDQTAYEPYAGAMKGATGTLLTRGGNHWDRALLLQKLLAAQGVEAQLAVAPLSPQEARRRFGTVAGRPAAATLLVQSLALAVSGATAEAGDGEWLEDFQARTAERAQELQALETVPEAWIAPALRGLKPAAIEAPTELVWVRAAIDGATVDFDPSLPMAKMGQAPAVTGDVAEMAEPSEETWHRVTIRCVAEHLTSAGELQRSDLLERTFPAAHLSGTGLRLALLPKTDGKEPMSEFRWILYAGDEEAESAAFRLQAQAGGGIDPGVSAGFGGLFGGEEEPEPAKPDAAAAQPSDAPRLARVFVEFTLTSPGVAPEIFRRTVVDRLEPAANGWRLMPALAEDRTVRPLLLQVWDLGIDLGMPHPAAVWETAIAAFESVEPVALFLETGAPLEQSDVRAPGVSPLVQGFFLASGLRRQALCAAARTCAVRPRLALLRRGTEIADWTNPGASAPRYREGVDIVNTPYRFFGDSVDTLKLARAAGVADTAFEVFASPQPATINTLPILAAAERQKIGFVVVATAPELEARALPLPVRDALLAEITAGRRVMLPEKPVAYASSHVFAWWSVDPASGYVLGRAELGGGQAMAEYSKLDEQIAEWTKIVSKFYGSVMRCYLKTLAKTLVTVDFDLKNAKVGAHVNTGQPGESPMPTAAQLQTCVANAACEAIADLINSRINAAVAGLEIKAYYEMFLKALKRAKYDSPKKAIEKGCQKKLGGGGS